jgi:uncharacterized protein (TIGR00269 family)
MMGDVPSSAGMRSCSCGKPSVYVAHYSGERLCAEHFQRSVEKRVRRELRQQGPFQKDAHFAVAVSGGKDSIVTLRLLHETFRDNPRVRITAVTVDEGIAGYRPPSIDVAAAHCREIGVEHRVVSYEEDVGLTMDRVAAIPLVARGAAPPREGESVRRHLPCAYCGVLRRRNLNRAAREADATHLATGHNLDDVAQSILMNHLKGDVDRLARMGPHRAEQVRPGLVPRVLPLRLIPEKEVALYAILRGWSYHDGECPYSVEATRGRYRDLLLDLEEKEPGTRHALLAGYDRLAPLLHAQPGAQLGACRACALVGAVGGRVDARAG